VSVDPHDWVHRRGLAEATPMSDRQFNQSTSRCLLIADDNDDAAESLAVLLRMEGHEVVVVGNGRDALNAVGTLWPSVVLLDIGMPDISGYEVARQLRQMQGGQALTLIAVTGWGQERDKLRAREAGFDHHFTKPIDPNTLLELVSRVDSDH
jgi:CheY-like chemotaxis protein